MESLKLATDDLSISEEIQLQWVNGNANQQSRCLIVRNRDIKVAQLRYAKIDETVKIFDLTCFDEGNAKHLSWFLATSLPANLRTAWFEPTAAIEATAEFSLMTSERTDNPAFARAREDLARHTAMSAEAEAAIKEVQERGAVFGARMEVYSRYPDFLSRQNEAERLSDVVSNTSRFLYRLKPHRAAISA
jgi:hypothetical protein